MVFGTNVTHDGPDCFIPASFQRKLESRWWKGESVASQLIDCHEKVVYAPVSHRTQITMVLRGLRAQSGDRLVCVRYRYDEQKQKRYKTVELVVAEENWTPSAPRPASEQVVAVRVSAPEVAIRQQVKSAAGQWKVRRQVWKLRYDRVVALGLSKRIVEAKSF